MTSFWYQFLGVRRGLYSIYDVHQVPIEGRGWGTVSYTYSSHSEICNLPHDHCLLASCHRFLHNMWGTTPLHSSRRGGMQTVGFPVSLFISYQWEISKSESLGMLSMESSCRDFRQLRMYMSSRSHWSNFRGYRGICANFLSTLYLNKSFIRNTHRTMDVSYWDCGPNELTRGQGGSQVTNFGHMNRTDLEGMNREFRLERIKNTQIITFDWMYVMMKIIPHDRHWLRYRYAWHVCTAQISNAASHLSLQASKSAWKNKALVSIQKDYW